MTTDNLDLESFLVRLKRINAVQVDTRPEGGFLLKHHELDPTARRSPIKIHLSTPDIRPEGKLTKVDVATIVRFTYEALEAASIHYDGIAGIPHSGNPIATGLRDECYTRRAIVTPLVQLSKVESGGKRHIGPIVNTDGLPRSTDFSVLPVDDVAFHAATKEEACEQLRLVYSVNYCAVFFNYCCGASEALERLRARLIAVATVPYALQLWRDSKDLSPADYDVVNDYINHERERWLAKLAA